MRGNMLAELPILFKKKEDCCGCAACYSSCPSEAILMLIDEMGFEYPHIDGKKCVRCLICINSCPIRN